MDDPRLSYLRGGRGAAAAASASAGGGGDSLDVNASSLLSDLRTAASASRSGISGSTSSHNHLQSGGATAGMNMNMNMNSFNNMNSMNSMNMMGVNDAAVLQAQLALSGRGDGSRNGLHGHGAMKMNTMNMNAMNTMNHLDHMNMNMGMSGMNSGMNVNSMNGYMNMNNQSVDAALLGNANGNVNVNGVNVNGANPYHTNAMLQMQAAASGLSTMNANGAAIGRAGVNGMNDMVDVDSNSPSLHSSNNNHNHTSRTPGSAPASASLDTSAHHYEEMIRRISSQRGNNTHNTHNTNNNNNNANSMHSHSPRNPSVGLNAQFLASTHISPTAISSIQKQRKNHSQSTHPWFVCQKCQQRAFSSEMELVEHDVECRNVASNVASNVGAGVDANVNGSGVGVALGSGSGLGSGLGLGLGLGMNVNTNPSMFVNSGLASMGNAYDPTTTGAIMSMGNSMNQAHPYGSLGSADLQNQTPTPRQYHQGPDGIGNTPGSKSNSRKGGSNVNALDLSSAGGRQGSSSSKSSRKKFRMEQLEALPHNPNPRPPSPPLTAPPEVKFRPQSDSGPGEKTCQLAHPVPLAMPTDGNWITPLHCFVRRHCVELFTASDIDVYTPSKGKRRPIHVGQVGIRCPHCHTSKAESTDKSSNREKGSVYYPTTIASIYNATMNLLQRHLSSCEHVPSDILRRYSELKADDARSGTSKKYWVDSARSLGLVDTEDGIRFTDETPPPLPTLDKQQMKMNTGGVMGGDNNGSATASEANLLGMQDMPLIRPEEKSSSTAFSYTLLLQMRACSFTEADRLGKRKGLPLGFAGLACKHCYGGYGSGRFFPSSIKTMSDTSKTLNVLHCHMARCRKCPMEIKQALQQLRLTHEDERAKMKFGSQKAFFTKIWERLHGSRPNEKRNTATASAKDATRPSTNESKDDAKDASQEQQRPQAQQEDSLNSPAEAEADAMSAEPARVTNTSSAASSVTGMAEENVEILSTTNNHSSAAHAGKAAGFLTVEKVTEKLKANLERQNESSRAVANDNGEPTSETTDEATQKSIEQDKLMMDATVLTSVALANVRTDEYTSKEVESAQTAAPDEDAVHTDDTPRTKESHLKRTMDSRQDVEHNAYEAAESATASNPTKKLKLGH